MFHNFRVLYIFILYGIVSLVEIAYVYMNLETDGILRILKKRYN